MTEPLLSFEEIRPYRDEEVSEVLQRISQKPSFALLMQYLFPEQPLEEIVDDFSKMDSVRDFQSTYIHQAVRRILEESTDRVTWDGFHQMDPDRKYLFLSNHRDIILDSAILNVLLFEEGFDTTKIAIGDNLMVSGLVTDLMKLNKSFVVHRDVARRNLIPFSQRLSHYIRQQITEGLDSVWIAQRNGRTKDGNDQTHAGLLKMLQISGHQDVKASFRSLNLIPMAISYEFDPCDGAKAEELYHLANGLPYEKDDKASMIQGIRGPKGRIHLSLGSPLNNWIEELPPPVNLNAWLRELADGIDREIHGCYRLWPPHFIAADLLAGEAHFTDQYGEEDQARFLKHLESQLTVRKGEPEGLKRQFLEIYAAPVWNRRATHGGYSSE